MPIFPEKNRRLRGSIQSFVVKPDDPKVPFVRVDGDVYLRVTEGFPGYENDIILHYNFDDSDWDPITDFVEKNVRLQNDLYDLLNVFVCITESFVVVPAEGDNIAYMPDEVWRYNLGTGIWELMETLGVSTAVELDNAVPKYTNDPIFARVTNPESTWLDMDGDAYQESYLFMYDVCCREWVDADLTLVVDEAALDIAAEEVDYDLGSSLFACVRESFSGYPDGLVLLYDFETDKWTPVDLPEVKSESDLMDAVPKSFMADDVSVPTGATVKDFVLETDGSEARFNVELPMGFDNVVVTVAAAGITGLDSDLCSKIGLLKYLWVDQGIIQSYLDGEGTIQIREDDEVEADDIAKNFAQVTATSLENEAVFEIATLLSMVFDADTTYAVGGGTEDVETGVYGNTPLGYKQVDDIMTAGTACPEYLCLLTARLTASKIATVRLGSSLSTLPNWVRAYKNEVYAQIQRLAVNAKTASMKGVSVRADFDLADVLLKMKTREHTAEDLER